MKSIALLAALLSFPALAAEKYATIAKTGKEPRAPSLTISDATCADNEECELAEFSCHDGGSFVISVDGVENADAGTLLKDKKGAASLAAGARVFVFNATRLEFSEMDGAWRVDLANRENPADAWKALSNAQKITLSVGGHTLAFPGDKNVGRIAKMCSK